MTDASDALLNTTTSLLTLGIVSGVAGRMMNDDRRYYSKKKKKRRYYDSFWGW